jgi:hypothetical protein
MHTFWNIFWINYSLLFCKISPLFKLLNWLTAEFWEEICWSFVGLKDPVIDGQFCYGDSLPLNLNGKISACWLFELLFWLILFYIDWFWLICKSNICMSY